MFVIIIHMSVIDDYLKNIEPEKRKNLERIRKIVKSVVDGAEDSINYGMPTLKYKGKAFLGFNVLKNHIGIYPYGGEEIEVFKKELVDEGFKFSKGGVQVPFDKTFPEDLLKKIILHRIKRI